MVYSKVLSCETRVGSTLYEIKQIYYSTFILFQFILLKKLDIFFDKKCLMSYLILVDKRVVSFS